MSAAPAARRREAGYAMVAAVVAVALLGLMSLAVIGTGRGVAAGVLAEAERARLASAADAALVVAVGHLADGDRVRRWSIDGRPRALRFAGTELSVTVEDERGKIPLNQLTEEQVRALFESFGTPGADTDRRVDAFLDWTDDDDEPRQDGAEAPYYAPLGRRPRNGRLASVEELMAIRGMGPEVVTRLRDVATIFVNERDSFDERYAAPLALGVLSGGGIDSPAAIDRARELAGQRTAIELASTETLTGRPLTIRIEARRPGGGYLLRRFVVVLTGHAANPFVVRRRD